MLSWLFDSDAALNERPLTFFIGVPCLFSVVLVLIMLYQDRHDVALSDRLRHTSDTFGSCRQNGIMCDACDHVVFLATLQCI